MTPTLLVIDAMSVAYRAFHAIAGLSTATGHPTNAVYGFIKTVTHIERIWKPTHCLVAFDGGIPQARIELLAEYKAQRPGMPTELKEQIGDIEEYLDCAAIKRIRMQGEEADDVIAAIAAKAGIVEMNTLIATGDKDLMQLVNQNTAILFPGRAEAESGPEEVFAKTGVKPDQIVSWLALTGDSSDNIPGVPGVGPKTAARWLAQWGTLEAVLEHVDELKPEKAGKALKENTNTVIRNVDIMTLDRSLQIALEINDLKIGTPDTHILLHFYKKMEFHSLVRGLQTPTLF